MNVVGGLGVPHTPHFPGMVERGDPLAAELERLYGALREHLDALRPDVLLVFSADHYNLFFVESVPIFSVGVAPETSGPNDYPLPQRDRIVEADLARHLQTALVQAEFDVGCSQEFTLDHPFTIPLDFVRPANDLPIVPFWISAFLRPIPSARRCVALGRAVGAALEALPDPRRVAVLASGSFSLEIGGPRMSATSHTGIPAPEWVDRVVGLLAAGDHDTLAAEATDAQLDHAGSAGGELLMWLAMLATFDPAPPAFLESQPAFGHAYGAWSAR